MFSRLSRRNSNPPREQIIALALRQTEAGRRLSIYDRGTGFVVPWYFVLRTSEEVARSARYKRPLCLITLESSEDAYAEVNAWLAKSLRNTDLICQNLDGRYFMLLTETDEKGTSEVAKRIISSLPVISLRTASYPAEEEQFRILISPLDVGWPAAA